LPLHFTPFARRVRLGGLPPGLSRATLPVPCLATWPWIQSVERSILPLHLRIASQSRSGRFTT